MRHSLIINFFIFIIFYCQLAFGAVHVNGYYKKNGTYVSPHYRSSPNQTASDNWSTKGNINPYTGEEGSKSVISNEGNPTVDPIKTNNGVSNTNIYENTNVTSFRIYKWTDKNNVTNYSDKPPP